MAEPKGRPKTLVRRHVLEIKKDTRDWLEEQIEEVKLAFIAGKGAGAIGDALGGFLGNPAAVPLLMGALMTAMGLAVGQDGIASVTEFFSSLQGLYSAKPGSEEQRNATSDFIESQRALIKFFAPFLPWLSELPSPPPDLQPEGPQGSGGGSG